MIEETPIRELKGVGEKTEKLFHKLGIFTVGDLLSHFPRDYDIYETTVKVSALEEGRVQAVEGRVVSPVSLNGRKDVSVISFVLEDESGKIRSFWFRMPFLKAIIKQGQRLILRGRVKEKGGELRFEQPEIFETREAYQKKLTSIQPLYKKVTGLSNQGIQKAVLQAYENLLWREDIPESVLKSYQLWTRRQAVKGIHFPLTMEEYQESRKRFVFEEFLEFLLRVKDLKEKNQEQKNEAYCPKDDSARELEARLPYELTKGQKRVLKEMKEDLISQRSMSRLLQGDVGSGKTILSFLCMLQVIENGYQAALMVPTEVLALQHFQSIRNLFHLIETTYKVALLVGSMSRKEKKEVYEKVESGEINVVIGTQALIQEGLSYHRLGLVVMDEQHRFGVGQREIFTKKGKSPHVLVMSATPIPRTLALILYGDLDISVLDEKPSNRIPIKNCVVGTEYRKKVYQFIEQELLEGRQSYIICPMVEEGEMEDLENVVDYSRELQREMGKTIRVEALHGKMKPEQKEELMKAFARNQIQVLVSTTVIEVGIDVPNATVILIENAERFGLSQLHQLRGRVGRGEHPSYCIFMTPTKSKEIRERLEILNKSNDGFFIAKEDLRLRGPGDLFGIRQSGLIDFQVGDIFQDSEILGLAAEASKDESISAYFTKKIQKNPKRVIL